MGSLYWQLNDCWPVASWSGIDYYGKWKALHYTVKDVFSSFLISHEELDDRFNVFVISDSLKSINATLKLRLIDFEGNELKKWSKKITVESSSSAIKMDLLKRELLNESMLKDRLLLLELIDESDNILTQNKIYFTPFKELQLPEPNLNYSILERGDVFEVILKTDKLAKDVFLVSTSTSNFSDNFFDLLPGIEKKVSIEKGQFRNLKSFEDDLKVITLYDTY
jgi:beta-mannosidase